MKMNKRLSPRTSGQWRPKDGYEHGHEYVTIDLMLCQNPTVASPSPVNLAQKFIYSRQCTISVKSIYNVTLVVCLLAAIVDWLPSSIQVRVFEESSSRRVLWPLAGASISLTEVDWIDQGLWRLCMISNIRQASPALLWRSARHKGTSPWWKNGRLGGTALQVVTYLLIYLLIYAM